MKKAYDVSLNSEHCIVFAETPAKAKWIAFRGYKDAGYQTYNSWPPTTVKRIPRYDKCRLVDSPPRPWTPDYVELCSL